MKQGSKETIPPNLSSRFADLSPAKRTLLQQRLQKKGLEFLLNQTIPRRATAGPAPLSFSQQRLWFLDQYEPNSSLYNVSSTVRLNGKLDIEALKRSLDEIVRRHDALRTTFANVNGEPFQVIAPAVNGSLAVIDLRDRPESEREERALRLAGREARRSFDLKQGPLFRATLMRLSEADHVLVLAMHHIVSDGWSMAVLYRELSVLYQAFSQCEPSPLAELPIQYGDYALWQRHWLQGAVLESQLSYWKKQLDGAPAMLDVPTDYPRPAVQSYRGAQQSIELSKELTRGLKALSQKEGVTLFMTLLAAFDTLLYRYTGQKDIVVGSPIANRNRAEIEKLIGFFVNTLVLRTDCSSDPTFKELLARVREMALEAYAHQDLPFEKLVEELKPERSLSHSPLFQMMFVLQNAPTTNLSFERVSVTPITIRLDAAKFDLMLAMRETVDGLKGSVQYNTDLFNDARITRLLGHLQKLFESVVADPGVRIGELSFLSDAEKSQLLSEWNETQRDYRSDKCVHDLFEEQAEKTPGAIALVFEGQQLTYRELNTRANRVAHCLANIGVGPETLVAICMERSFELVVGLLGILKAGGAYVPLDPNDPKERLAFMLEDTQVPVLLTQERLLANLPDHGARVVCLDRDWQQIAADSGENLITGMGAENLAYVTYTSGSTGQPKGVAVLHRGILRLLTGVEYVRLDANQTLLQLAPISFDASTFEIWGALLHGARCVLFSGKIAAPNELGNILRRSNVGTLWLTASLFNLVIDEVPEALSEVRQLLIGGEALSVSHVQRALALLPRTQIINGYGPTESTTFTCCYSIPRRLDENITSISIGRPVANSKVYLLDSQLSPVPVGVTGELYIGGDGLARGYLNRPELTAEKFIPDPFCQDPGARLYKSGDLARFLSNGNIEFLGRTDHQVKIRGFRIELGEIEAALRQHPAVQQTVVLVRQKMSGEKSLVAYLVSSEESISTVNELRSFLRQKLPEYMVPSSFVTVAALPLLPSGKIDRNALPAPDEDKAELSTFVAPRTAVEELLVEIWAEVLKVEKVGVSDNFFELGGHSLLATQVISRLHKTFDLSLPLQSLFENPTIEGLARIIRTTEVDRSNSLAGAITPVPRQLYSRKSS
jgi:amino acid adenylation domain-containing protein